MYTSLLGMVHYEIKCFQHHNYNRLLACHKTNYQCIQKLFLKRIISVFKTYFFFIEIGVLKANGIKHNEYSSYIVFGFIKVLLGERKHSTLLIDFWLNTWL